MNRVEIAKDVLDSCVSKAINFGFTPIVRNDTHVTYQYDEPHITCVAQHNLFTNVWDVCAYEKDNPEHYDCILVAQPSGVDLPAFVNAFKTKRKKTYDA